MKYEKQWVRCRNCTYLFQVKILKTLNVRCPMCDNMTGAKTEEHLGKETPGTPGVVHIKTA